MRQTKSTKIDEIKHDWMVFDAKGKVLGRFATEVAHALMGKAKTNYVPHLDCGNNVVVINGNSYVTTGKKEKNKMYGNYSGYPGGLKEKSLMQLRLEKPEEPLRHAVYGMLPKNKLRDRLMVRLHIFTTEDHPYKQQVGSTVNV